MIPRALDPTLVGLSLSSLLQPLFPARDRRRQAREGGVEFVVIDDDAAESVRATVHGDDSHDVLLRFEPPQNFSASCTCPLFRRTGSCRHVWAVVREVDERGLAIGNTASTVEGDPLYSALDPRKELWKARLDAVKDKMLEAVPDPWDGLVVRRPKEGIEILYILDVDDTKSGRGLVLRPFWRERQRNHRWSRRKPMDPENEDCPTLDDPLDRRIFRGLRGARRSAWSPTAHLTSFGGSGAYWLDDAECELLLPILGATKRAFLHYGGEDEPEALVMDEGEPWRFGVRLEKDDGTQRARVCFTDAGIADGVNLDHVYACMYVCMYACMHACARYRCRHRRWYQP